MSPGTTQVLLATCREWPQGEPEGQLLTEAFAAVGVASRWVCWDALDVDWAAADLVAVRSTWDYDTRREEFLAWAAGVGPRLLHGADVFAWNLHKRYLLELAAVGIPIVPTTLAEDEAALAEAARAFEEAVVKPAVGAGGRGITVVGEGDGTYGRGPWVVQPLVRSVRTEGEHSVFVLGGEACAQVTKRPSGREIRVHEHYGGRTDVVAPDPEATDLAIRTVRAAERLLGTTLTYGRVDLLRLADGRLAVGELEATEPGLYLDRIPANADRFVAAALAARAG